MISNRVLIAKADNLRAPQATRPNINETLLLSIDEIKCLLLTATHIMPALER